MDEFQFWRDALAGKDVQINPDDPQPGYYKARRGRGGPWLPVAIWRISDGLVARHGPDAVEPSEIWTWCAGNPIDKQVAKYAFEHGSFPGDVAPAEIGHNAPPESISERVREYADQALEWLKGISRIASQKDADMAANYRAELLRLSKAAESERKEKVQPHVDAQKQINAEYKPIVDAAKDAADDLRKALSEFMRAEEARQREEAKRRWEAEQEAARKERERVEAERAALEQEDPIAALTSPEPELPSAPAAPDPVKVNAGGQRGRKAGLREVTSYVVVDHAAALAHFADHDDVKALVQQLAARTCKAAKEAIVPGVEKRTEKVAA